MPPCLKNSTGAVWIWQAASVLCTGAEALIELSLYYYTAVAALLPISARLADTFSLNTCLTSTFLSSLIIQPSPHSVSYFLQPPLTLPALVFTLGHTLLIVPESLQVNLFALCPLAHGLTAYWGISCGCCEGNSLISQQQRLYWSLLKVTGERKKDSHHDWPASCILKI